MADKPPVRKIPEGVSGLGKTYDSPEPTNTVGSMGGKPMGGSSEYGSTMGGTWKRPSNYRRGGRIDVNPKNPFAAGGPQLPRTGHDTRKFGLKR